VETATHLYHIAQEAVNNAIKHGGAKNIVIRLAVEDDHAKLCIVDDGSGIPEDRGNTLGMGLHIMGYRSSMIGGRLEIERNESRGTTICCVFPALQT
jgi:signal transduction histidine kinase